MVLIAPLSTTKSFPKFQSHHHNFTPPHIYNNHSRCLRTTFWAVTTNRHHKRRALQVANAAAAESFEQEKVVLSDVVVDQQRKWNVKDIVIAGVVAVMHLLCGFAPFTFSWGALWVAFGLYLVTGLLGLEYAFVYCGVHALQGSPIDWVSTHRYHHQYCDSHRDPHSPIEGFWFSHMSWLFDTKKITEKCGEPNNVADLEKQSFYRFLQTTYVIHPIALAILLYALGGFPFIVWGMGVRIVWVYHITWLVNSACHVWGKQAWDTGDLSRNNWWVGILAFGEGWHNNHHAFECSARHGLEWWQIDMTWSMIRFLEIIGLANDVKLPTPTNIQKMSFPPRT